MRKILAIVGLFGLAVLAGCGSSGSTVKAATTYSYSNASVSGTYAFMYGWDTIGTFTADGNGNITSEAGNFGGCTFSITGTYTAQSNGSGTAAFSATPGGSNPCSSSTVQGLGMIGNPSFTMEVAQQGSSLYLLNTSAGLFASKQ